MEKRTDPVFVIGHWRSGTSYLQYLLSRDPQFVWHDKYQGLFPDIYLSTEHSLRTVAERFLNLFRAVSEWRENISVDMELNSPIEIESAYVNAGLPTTYHWGHVFPQKWEYYSRKFLFMEEIDEEELDEWKNALQFACKKIRFENPDSRVLIKNPGDTARIRHILEVYPDAKFIYIHRNPYDVFYSNKKLWRGILQSIALQQLTEPELNELILHTYERLLNHYLEQRELIPGNNLVEIGMEDLANAPIEQLNRIYKALALGDFEKIRARMETLLRQADHSKASDYDYDEGVIERINKRWRFAFERWNYEMQGKPAKEYETV